MVHLEALGAYPLLLGRPWLKTANIKQNWNKNILTFRKVKNKIHVRSVQIVNVSQYMMEGLDEIEENHYFNDNPKIIPLFEVDILQALTSYVENKHEDIPIDDQTMKEIRLQQEATEKEM